MGVIFESPWPFPERMLFFGGGGAGKTNCSVSIAAHVDATFRVIECDLSAAWMRSIATDFPDIEDRVEITNTGDWSEFLPAVEQAVEAGDPEEDWLVIDSSTPSWAWVQEFAMEQMYGDDLPTMLMSLRREYAGKPQEEFFKAKSELLSWDVVKPEYAKFWRALGRWRGNLILTAEAKAVSRRDFQRDDEAKRLYGVLGYYPAGESSIRHAMSTTLFLDHPDTGVWRMTTIKDRNREEQDKLVIGDFGIDYLAGVAGWNRRKGGGSR